MTSEERRQARYIRRKARRERNRQARSDSLGGLETAFSYRKMFFHGKKCCNGVGWKASTQNFRLHLFSGTAKRRREVLERKWRQGKTVRFLLRERGKIRIIDAPHIKDRQVHKVFTREVLSPLYSPSMIYDNGASQKGKGLHFHYQRLKEQLRWHYRRHGRQGAILLADFHHFFPDAPHALLYERHRCLIPDPDLRALADLMVAAVPGEVGMYLGVEPSQQEMVALPSYLDNWMKCRLSLHGMGHYMDDYYAILGSAERAETVLGAMIRRAEEKGLAINRNKCHVIALDKPFRFCKAKFQITPSGRIITHGCRDGMKRARRKLKYFRKCGKDAAEVAEWLNGPIAYYEQFNDHGRVLRLRRLYYALFVKGRDRQEAKQCTRS